MPLDKDQAAKLAAILADTLDKAKETLSNPYVAAPLAGAAGGALLGGLRTWRSNRERDPESRKSILGGAMTSGLLGAAIGGGGALAAKGFDGLRRPDASPETVAPMTVPGPDGNPIEIPASVVRDNPEAIQKLISGGDDTRHLPLRALDAAVGVPAAWAIDNPGAALAGAAAGGGASKLTLDHLRGNAIKGELLRNNQIAMADFAGADPTKPEFAQRQSTAAHASNLADRASTEWGTARRMGRGLGLFGGDGVRIPAKPGTGAGDINMPRSTLETYLLDADDRFKGKGVLGAPGRRAGLAAGAGLLGAGAAIGGVELLGELQAKRDTRRTLQELIAAANKAKATQ